MSYQVPQYIDPNKIFLVNRSGIERRLDPSIYKSSFKFLSNTYRNVNLSQIAYINPNVSFVSLKPDDIISFIPMNAIDEKNGYIAEYKTRKISDTKGFTRFQTNDLLWAKITPCMQNGKSAIAKDLLNGYGCGSTEFFIIRSKDQNVLVEYLHFLLHYEKVLKSAQNYFGGSAGQQRVPVSFLENFNVPLLPLAIQQNIVDIMNVAYEQKRNKEAEAQKLLDSIDDYLLGELGIALPDTNMTPENIPEWMSPENPLVKNGRLFLTKFSEVEGNRFDPMNTLYLGQQVKSLKYHNTPLNRIANIQKGQAITSDQIIPGIYPVIAGGQSSPYSHSCYNNEKNVITISASGAYAGYVWYHDYPIFASDCSVVKSKNESGFFTKYIFEILKVQQKNIYRLQQGAGQPHVYPTDLAKLLIPEISIKKQNEICNYISNIRKRVQSLQEESQDILQQAKKKVEQMIIK